MRLFQEDGTVYGIDRNEMIHLQGARGTKIEDLFHSEGAYLTWLYCLMAQPIPDLEHVAALGQVGIMPAGLKDREPVHFLGEHYLCRQLLRELAERELAMLRPREKLLRELHEVPARDGAEIRKQVLADPLGAQLVRLAQSHDREYLRVYEAFRKGRERSARTGLVPGISTPAVQGQADAGITPDREPESDRVETARAERRQGAEALAPGTENGIGAPIPQGDVFRAAVMATGPLSEEELRAVGR